MAFGPIVIPLAPKVLKVLQYDLQADRYTFSPRGAEGLTGAGRYIFSPKGANGAKARPRAGRKAFSPQGAKGPKARLLSRSLHL